MSISHLVEDLITSAGYPAVFALVGVESLGIPLPGETALVLASIYAGTTHRLSPWLIFAAAAAGFFAGGALERLSLTIDLALGGIATLAIIGGIVLLRRRMAGLTERAGKAYPGPLE